jgi:transcriptional regulator with XRE-family HTH domain
MTCWPASNDPLTGPSRASTVSTSVTLPQLGARIQQLRERRGMTQQQLADAAKLSLVYISKLEQGQRTSPSLPALNRIARALGARLNIDLAERNR